MQNDIDPEQVEDMDKGEHESVDQFDPQQQMADTAGDTQSTDEVVHFLLVPANVASSTVVQSQFLAMPASNQSETAERAAVGSTLTEEGTDDGIATAMAGDTQSTDEVVQCLLVPANVASSTVVQSQFLAMPASNQSETAVSSPPPTHCLVIREPRNPKKKTAEASTCLKKVHK